MEELPFWLRVYGENPVLKSVLQEMFANPNFRAHIDSVFSHGRQDPYMLSVGDRSLMDVLNRRPGVEPVAMDDNVGAVSILQGAQQGGIAVDVDKLHAAVAQDSTQARDVVRDALLHEFAHVIPVAQGGQRTGDPKPGARNAAKHPAIQGENRLRGLFGLPAKQHYGLLGGGR